MMRIITDPAEADLYYKEGLLYYRINAANYGAWVLDRPEHNPPSEIMTSTEISHGLWDFAIDVEE